MLNPPVPLADVKARRVLLSILLVASAATAASQETATRGSQAVIKPDKGELSSIKPIRVTFPTPMVDIDKVKRGGQLSPVVFEPVAELRWRWVSQLEGEITFPPSFLDTLDDRPSGAARMRNVARRAKLRQGLKDAAGRPVDTANWGVEFEYDRFEIRGIEFLNAAFDSLGETPKTRPGENLRQPNAGPGAENDDSRANIDHRALDWALSARPRVRLEFSRDVLPEEVQRSVYFQVAQTHKRFPVEVDLEDRQPRGPVGWVLIEPIDPLPASQAYLLVIDSFKTPGRTEALPHLYVVPAGTTYTLAVRRVSGFNQPVTGTFIRITTSHTVDSAPSNLSRITVTPAVANLHAVTGEYSIDLQGDFDTAREYHVTVDRGLKSTTVLDLAERSNWKVHFHAKRPAIILPQKEMFQRASAPVGSCLFTQVNTAELEWRVAQVPADKLQQLRKRLREFGQKIRDPKDPENKPIVDPASGEYRYPPTEPLVTALFLPVLASGTCPPSDGDKEVERKIEWRTGTNEPGIYVIEITGHDLKGRSIGNRSIISRSDWVITEIESSSTTAVQVLNIKDGRPVAGLPIQMLGSSGSLAAVTDGTGEARFDAAQVAAVRRTQAMTGFSEMPEDLIIAGTGDKLSFQLLNLPTFGSDRFDPQALPPQGSVSLFVTDRNLYRPGETVMLKGFVRTVTNGVLSIPSGKSIDWQVSSHIWADEPTVFKATAPLSTSGSWEATWQIPATANGNYYLEASGHTQKITVGDFRPPSFSITTDAPDAEGDTARARVTSVHFHGAPNAGAKVHWKAEWLVDNWRNANEPGYWFNKMTLTDEYSPDSAAYGLSRGFLYQLASEGWDTERPDREVSISSSSQGDATLDANGNVELECKWPFPPSAKYSRAKVFWIVDVTSAAAETLRCGAVAKIQRVPNVLGVRLDHRSKNTLALRVESFDAKDVASAGVAVRAELFLVNIKTIKEKLGNHLHQYRNFPTFEPIWQADLVTPATSSISVPHAGNYVVRVTSPKQPEIAQVSEGAMVEGVESAEVPVVDDYSIGCKPDKDRYTVGETALIDVQSPFAGVAAVTVEAEQVLDRELIQFRGNLQRIPIRILPSYAPTVQICVHVIQAVSNDAVPGERFGYCKLRVERPEQKLHVSINLRSDAVEPGQEVSGRLKIVAAGHAVQGADVLLFAVDEAVLQLGRWKLPDFETFFPPRSWNVQTHAAFGESWRSQRPHILSHSQKGYILGDAGPKVRDITFRKDFRALAFWNGALRTDGKGEATFRFKAPESLTSYRIVAIAQHGTDQFGTAMTNTRVTKRLQVEPFVPDFLRMGDEVDLRAIVRQNYSDSESMIVRVATDGAIALKDTATKEVLVRRGEPMAVTFRAFVRAEADHGVIRLSAQSRAHPKVHDGAEISLAVHPAVLELHRAVYGEINALQPLNVSAAVPQEWSNSNGNCDVLLSGSPFLPKIAGLRTMLESEGSLEKLATRILAGTILTETLEYLPAKPQFENQLRARITEGLKKFARGLVEDRGVALWPGSADRSDFATIEAAWAILAARQRNIAVDESLVAGAKIWLEQIASKRIGFDEVPSDLRCFAVMVRALMAKDFPVQQELTESGPISLSDTAKQLVNDRQTLSDEGRSWLALALHYLEVYPDLQQVLLAELQSSSPGTEFDPITFSSGARVEAIRLLALSEIQSSNWSNVTREEMKHRFSQIVSSSVDLSTQENLWLLLLFNSLTRGDVSPAMAERPLTPQPSAVSRNRISAGWFDVPLDKLAQIFAQPLTPGVNGTYLLRATYQNTGSEVVGSPSLNIRRELRNLSEPSRVGTPESPFQLGDEILITYQLNANKPHSYLALEDQLPACFETINPNLPMIAEYFKLPIEAGVNTLSLSHADMYFARTVLYFDKAPAGRNIYATVARVTAAGTYHWPGVQVQPLYDTRFHSFAGASMVSAQSIPNH